MPEFASAATKTIDRRKKEDVQILHLPFFDIQAIVTVRLKRAKGLGDSRKEISALKYLRDSEFFRQRKSKYYRR